MNSMEMCKTCMRVGLKPQVLDNHSKFCGNSDYRYHCPTCFRLFKKYSNLDRHCKEVCLVSRDLIPKPLKRSKLFDECDTPLAVGGNSPLPVPDPFCPDPLGLATEHAHEHDEDILSLSVNEDLLSTSLSNFDVDALLNDNSFGVKSPAPPIDKVQKALPASSINDHDYSIVMEEGEVAPSKEVTISPSICLNSDSAATSADAITVTPVKIADHTLEEGEIVDTSFHIPLKAPPLSRTQKRRRRRLMRRPVSVMQRVRYPKRKLNFGSNLKFLAFKRVKRTITNNSNKSNSTEIVTAPESVPLPALTVEVTEEGRTVQPDAASVLPAPSVPVAGSRTVTLSEAELPIYVPRMLSTSKPLETLNMPKNTVNPSDIMTKMCNFIIPDTNDWSSENPVKILLPKSTLNFPPPNFECLSVEQKFDYHFALAYMLHVLNDRGCNAPTVSILTMLERTNDLSMQSTLHPRAPKNVVEQKFAEIRRLFKDVINLMGNN